jgi:hypothetical protein
MIQFNLLPDVKLEYIKANRLKRAVTVISVIVAGAALTVFVLLYLSVDVVQKHHLNDLNNQITSLTNKLKNQPDLDQILTVQNAINVLPSLYTQNPVVTRLPGYLSELTPSSATIGDINIDFSSANTISITGSADSLLTINQFVDTLKLCSFQTSASSTPQNAFSDVLLTSYSLGTTVNSTIGTNSGPSYSITATFNPAIFSASYSNVTLNVPNINTSHTSSSQSALFQSVQTSTPNTDSGQ